MYLCVVARAKITSYAAGTHFLEKLIWYFLTQIKISNASFSLFFVPERLFLFLNLTLTLTNLNNAALHIFRCNLEKKLPESTARTFENMNVLFIDPNRDSKRQFIIFFVNQIFVFQF